MPIWCPVREGTTIPERNLLLQQVERAAKAARLCMLIRELPESGKSLNRRS